MRIITPLLLLNLLVQGCDSDSKADSRAVPSDDTSPADTGEPDSGETGDSEDSHSGDTGDTADTDSGETGETADTDSGETGDSRDSDDPGTDDDLDGFTDEGGDCDDADPAVHPGAKELVGDGKDNDCDGFFGETSWVILAADTSILFGTAMSPGDLDGDGLGDLVVGAGYAHSLAGAVYLFSGASIHDEMTEAEAVASIEGVRFGADARTGAVPSRRVGDLDGDGIDELGYGAQYEDVGGVSNTGAWYLWRSSTSLTGALFSDDADASFYDTDGASESGTTAAGVGDLDGDGYDDLAIASPRGGGLWNGRVWVISGGELVYRAWQPLADAAAGCRIGSDYAILGETILDRTDVDDDGNADLVLGAYNGVDWPDYTGAVEINYGPWTPSMDDPSYDTLGQGPGDYSYYGAAIERGDFDADGSTDLLIGAFGASSAHLAWGDGTRPSALDLADLDSFSHSGIGRGVGAADLDADGATDLVLGTSSGDRREWVIQGGDRFGVGVDPESVSAWTTEDDRLSPTGRLVTIESMPGSRPAAAFSATNGVLLLVQAD